MYASQLSHTCKHGADEGRDGDNIGVFWTGMGTTVISYVLQMFVRTIRDIIARYGGDLPQAGQPGISSARPGRGGGP